MTPYQLRARVFPYPPPTSSIKSYLGYDNTNEDTQHDNNNERHEWRTQRRRKYHRQRRLTFPSNLSTNPVLRLITMSRINKTFHIKSTADHTPLPAKQRQKMKSHGKKRTLRNGKAHIATVRRRERDGPILKRTYWNGTIRRGTQRNEHTHGQHQ